ncbi:MAG: ECF transporter S component [Candidatus Bruticola sp.]
MVTSKMSAFPSGSGRSTSFSLSDWLKISIMSALALLLMMTVRLPILPMAPFLTYDFSEVPALVVAFSLGPVAGAVVELIKCALFMTLNFNPLQLVGVPANLVTGLLLVCTSSKFYNLPSGEAFSYKRLCKAMLLGSVVTTVVMLPVNFLLYLILQKFFAELMSMSVGAYLIGAALPFNFIKCLISCTAAGLCIRRLFPYLSSK